MNWILASVAIIFSSVVLYLGIRRAKDQDIALELRNLAMFALPAVLIFIYNTLSGISLVINPFQLLIIILASIFLSWLGNIASLKAIELAPNPGYSLIISKSYVVMTTILSVWLFGSVLTWIDSLAIFLIVGFSGLIMINPSSEKSNKKFKQSLSWLWFTFVAFFAWGFLALVLTYLTSLGIASTVIVFYLMTFVSLLILGQMVLKRISFSFNKSQLKTLLVIGVSSTIFNLGLVIGYKLAPNPGFINAVNAGSIGLVTLASAYFFKDELSVRKLFGVFGVLAGLGMLFVG